MLKTDDYYYRTMEALSCLPLQKYYPSTARWWEEKQTVQNIGNNIVLMINRENDKLYASKYVHRSKLGSAFQSRCSLLSLHGLFKKLSKTTFMYGLYSAMQYSTV